MVDLILLGHTVSRFEMALQPSVNEYTGESQRGFAVRCDMTVPPNSQRCALIVQISIGAYLPEEKPMEERLPFVALEATFIFTFRTADTCERADIENGLRTSGLQTVIPLMRGVLVGTCEMLNLPSVFDFPGFGPDDVTWGIENNDN